MTFGCAAIESLRAWERDEIPKTDCRTAAFEAHAAARDAIEAGVPDAVAAARAAARGSQEVTPQKRR
jgi:hypothetical protein